MHRSSSLCSVKLFQKPSYDHYFVHFLGKGGGWRWFNVNQASGSLPYAKHNGQNFWWCLSFKLADFLSLFILLLCSHAGSPLGVKLAKTWRLSTMFEKVLTFCVARGFDLALSLGMTITLLIPVMAMS